MFSSANRLRKDQDIAHVLKSKRSVFDSACGMKFAANGLSDSRFAVVVGTKVSKNAVDRNRIKRQYREIIKAHISDFPKGLDVIFLVSKPALTLSYADKKTKLERVFAKSGLLKKHPAVPPSSNPPHSVVPKDAVV